MTKGSDEKDRKRWKHAYEREQRVAWIAGLIGWIGALGLGALLIWLGWELFFALQKLL